MAAKQGAVKNPIRKSVSIIRWEMSQFTLIIVMSAVMVPLTMNGVIDKNGNTSESFCVLLAVGSAVKLVRFRRHRSILQATTYYNMYKHMCRNSASQNPTGR